MELKGAQQSKLCNVILKIKKNSSALQLEVKRLRISVPNPPPPPSSGAITPRICTTLIPVVVEEAEETISVVEIETKEVVASDQNRAVLTISLYR